MVSFRLEDVAERYGILKPSQFIGVVALVGDKSDNILGSDQLLLSRNFGCTVIFVGHMLILKCSTKHKKQN